MKKYQYLTMYGIIIVSTGLIIFSLVYNPSEIIKYFVSAGLLSSAAFAFMTSYKSRRLTVPLQYHALQGIGLLIFGIVILSHAHTLEIFIFEAVSFLLFFGISEILIGFHLFLISTKEKTGVIVYRVLIGFLTVLGSFLIFTTSYIDTNMAIITSGLVFILGGVGFILFANFLKKLDYTGLNKLTKFNNHINSLQ